MTILSPFMSVYHMHPWCLWRSDFLELEEIQMGVSCQVGSENQDWSSPPVLLPAEPSLQPLNLVFE